jgi:hypothetical protein
MPGVDYAALRARISILDVLGLVHFQPVRRSGDRLRGLCPCNAAKIHEGSSSTSPPIDITAIRVIASAIS